MYLFFDTETTGLPKDWKAPVTNLSNWPRMVQLAFLLHDADGNLLSDGDYIIKPEGFTIPAEASQIHGISTERAIQEGLPLNDVLLTFREVMKQSTCLVAHNLSFDERIVGAELLRCGMRNDLMTMRRICTMHSATNYCAIKNPNGYSGYKWPKLSELHRKLFGYDFEEAHNAAVDIEATARCFWELRRRGLIDA
jgi:DNA polymerase III epsilon subunit-like protein